MLRSTITLVIAVLIAACSSTQDLKPEWPRVIDAEGHKVVIYQPQAERWDSYSKIHARTAIAVTEKGKATPTYGWMQIQAKTETDFEDRQVLVKERKIDKLSFPNAPAGDAVRLSGIVKQLLGEKEQMIVPLDTVIGSLERTKEQTRKVVVNFAPPPIYRSEKPAILVIFIGEPSLKPVVKSELLFATNTNWDVFLHTASARYYLRNGMSWLMTEDVNKGPWVPAGALPAEFSRLPKSPNWEDTRKAVPGVKTTTAPVVFVSTRPAEMIISTGPPIFEPIAGTKLLYLKNSENDVFLGGGNYYYLTAGRWFRARALDGPWVAATKDLPADFKLIPEKHPRGRVLASVPGTPEAEEAILLASIPRKVTVTRSSAKVVVRYEGAPKFMVIDGTKVYYAVNSPYDVFRVGKEYYCCYQGVWFQAPTTSGPWVVATSVPSAIYTIPATSPKYNVTYVYVYDSTPTTVVVGYTSGYVGCYVAAGVVVFGACYYANNYYAHSHYYGYHCHSHYYGYGCGASYNYYAGQYYRGATAYGPYGGVGRGAAYNPATGTYSRSAAAYGPNGSRYANQAYNPRTGTYAARTGGSSPYGSWNRSAVSRGNQWARGGSYSNARGTVGGFKTSGGAKGVVGRGAGGSQGGVVKTRHGDVYAGKDGNVYKRNSDGTWQKRQNGKWTNTQAGNRAGTNRAGTSRTGSNRAGAPRTGTNRGGGSGGRSAGRGSRGSVQGGLNRHSRARSRGNSWNRGGGRSRGGGSRGGGRGGGGRR